MHQVTVHDCTNLAKTTIVGVDQLTLAKCDKILNRQANKETRKDQNEMSREERKDERNLNR